MQKNTMFLVLLAFVSAMAIGSIAYVSGSGGPLLSTVSIPGGSGTAPDGSAVFGTEECGQNKQPIYTISATYKDPTQNDNLVTAAALYDFYQGENPVGIAPGTTSNVTTAGQLTCGQTARFVYGARDMGNVTYYVKQVETPITLAAGKVYTILTRAAAPTVDFKNDTGAYASTVTLKNGTVAGKTYNSITLRITAPTTQTFGDQGYAICTRFQSTNISKVYPGNYLQEETIKHWKASSTKDTVKCYRMADETTPERLLEKGAVREISLIIEAVSGTHPAQADAIDVTLYDRTGILFNGIPQVGYESHDGLGTKMSRAFGPANAAISFTAAS